MMRGVPQKSIVALGSGQGSTIEFFCQQIQKKACSFNIKAIVTENPQSRLVQLAENFKIPCHILPYSKNKAVSEKRATSESQATSQNQASSQSQATSQNQATSQSQTSSQNQATSEKQAISENKATSEKQVASEKQATSESQAHEFYSTTEDFKLWDKNLAQILISYNPSLIVLAGFLKKIGPEVIQNFPDRIINSHPSLLPDFGGKGFYGLKVHQAVLSARKKETGVSIHLVNSEYDKGKIIKQCCIPVLETDSPESLEKRVKEKEKRFYLETIESFLNRS